MWSNHIFGALVIMLLVPWSTAASHAVPLPPATPATTTAVVSLYDGPGLHYPIQRNIGFRVVVDVVATPENTAWYQVRYAGRTGYVQGTSLAQQQDRPVVYLTFDDGPHPVYTPQVLALLERYHAQATFFVLGRAVDAYPELVQAIQQSGSSVQNHTYNHPDLTQLSAPRVATELTQTAASIQRVTGQAPTCMRPPYGALNATTRHASIAAGFPPVLWDVDPQDWRRPGVEAIVARVLGSVRPNAIVLFHEGDDDGDGDRTQTIAALECLLPTLVERGYRFGTLCGI